MTNKSASFLNKNIDSEEEDVEKIADIQIIVKVYKRRWLMLGLYLIFTALVCSQWVQYCIITNIITRYYSVSTVWVNCSSMVFMVSYMVTIFPMSYVIERIGLKWTLVVGSTFCCAGAWIKTFSVSPDRFYVTMIGQAVVSLSVVIVQTTPGRVAVNWFPSYQLSTATSLGIFGSQLGSSLTFLLIPLTVLNHDTIGEIGKDLSSMFIRIAIASTISLMLIVLVFQQEPKYPANETRALKKKKHAVNEESFKESLKSLFTNKSFLLLCNSYGLNIGVLSAITTLLNQLFLLHFKNSESDVGKVAMFIILTGMVGSVSFGIVLDKTHKFKETAVIAYFCIVCGQIAFAIAMLLEIKYMVFAIAIFLGFFMTGYASIGYELATELTYPAPVTLGAGIMHISTNVFGILIISAIGQVLVNYGDLAVYVIFCLIMVAGFVMITMTKNEQRRQDAIKAVIKCNDNARVGDV